MKSAKIIIKTLAALFLMESAFPQAVLVDDPDDPKYRDNHKQYMKTSGVILDICVYEQEFQPSERKDSDSLPWTSGTLVKRAVVVGVHKGDVKVGTKIDISETVINPPEFLTKFRSVVEGELLTYFYFGEELPEQKDGRHVVDHNQMDFKRDADKDVVTFLKELDAKPAKNKKSEQAETGQSATRADSDSEGVDIAQPEADGRRR